MIVDIGLELMKIILVFHPFSAWWERLPSWPRKSSRKTATQVMDAWPIFGGNNINSLKPAFVWLAFCFGFDTNGPIIILSVSVAW